MRVLHIGGTGLISSACVRHDLAAGWEVWVLNRGVSMDLPLPEGIHHVVADASDHESVRSVLGAVEFEAVVQWIAFAPSQVSVDLDLYRGVGQYVFISSASVYETPPSHYLVNEDRTPLSNPYWEYSRNKIACEVELVAANERDGFPVTIVRPSHTYGPSQIPVAVGSWEHPFTIVDRMRRGAKIIVPGDGTSLWTVTHNTDFAKGLHGLLGNPGAIGEDFHITSDEAPTWNAIYRMIGAAAGVEPDLLHVPTDALKAADSEMEGSLWGDKAHSTVFDTSKLRALVPDFEATVPFAEGIKESVAWFDADPARQTIDDHANAVADRVAAIYVDALRRINAE